jgi:hypothetical protein
VAYRCSILAILLFTRRLCAATLAQSATNPGSLTDQYPWLKDFIAAILALGMICLLIYFFRAAGPAGVDFSIEVDGEDVSFKGRFPTEARGLVEEFLVNDCRVPGAYEVTGKWDEGRLAVSVRGDNAKPVEQRIRNFLKLHVKRPG